MFSIAARPIWTNSSKERLISEQAAMASRLAPLANDFFCAGPGLAQTFLWQFLAE
jgi:hypothetical protein